MSNVVTPILKLYILRTDTRARLSTYTQKVNGMKISKNQGSQVYNMLGCKDNDIRSAQIHCSSQIRRLFRRRHVSAKDVPNHGQLVFGFVHPVKFALLFNLSLHIL